MSADAARVQLILEAVDHASCEERVARVAEELRVAQLIAYLRPFTPSAKDAQAAQRSIPRPRRASEIETRVRKSHHWGPLEQRYRPRSTP